MQCQAALPGGPSPHFWVTNSFPFSRSGKIFRLGKALDRACQPTHDPATVGFPPLISWNLEGRATFNAQNRFDHTNNLSAVQQYHDALAAGRVHLR